MMTVTGIWRSTQLCNLTQIKDVMNFLEDSGSNEDKPKQKGSTRALQQEMPPVESGKHCKTKHIHFDVTSESNIFFSKI